MKMHHKLPLLLLGWLAVFFSHPGRAHDGPSPRIEAAIDLQPLEAALRQGPRNVTLKVLLVIVDAIPGDKIGQSVRVDLGAYTRLLNILEAREILKVERTVLQGTKATLANVRQALKAIKPGPDDVFLFFFSGHGGMEAGNKTFLQCHDERLLYRSELNTVVGQMPARLKLVISDACSNAVDGVAPNVALSSARSGGANSANDALYKQLFLNFRGTASISASTEGEYAWSNDEMGGFFTHYFVKEGLIKKPEANWQSIFEFARQRTVQMYNKFPEEQKRELAKDGIKSQTPKAYTLPAPANGAVANNGGTTQGNGAVPVPASKAQIVISNFSGRIVDFALDNNPSTSVWSATKTEPKRLAVNTKTGIAKNLATILFTDGGEDYFYDLEPGNYFFALNHFDELDLFAEEPGVSPQEIARPDLTKFLANGDWFWEDNEGAEIKTTFRPNGNFTDTYLDGNTTDAGQWSLTKETIDGHTYQVVHFLMKDDNGEFDMSYALVIEEGGHCIQLVYLRSAENGEEIPYEAMEENPNFNPILVMYRE